LLAAGAAQADLADWTVSPLAADVGEAQFQLGGAAYGAAFGNDQPAFPGLSTSGVTGALRFVPRLERSYDSGLVLGLHATVLAYHDHLTNDRYDGTVFEKVYGSVQTGLGTVELGDADGAAYRLAVTGPKVSDRASLDDPQITFFRDPLTGRAFDEIFTVRTDAGASSNFAKLSYFSPRLFGAEIAVSFAPSEGHNIIPLVSSGPHVPDRQRNLFEFAGSYTDYFGPVSFSGYGGLSVGHNAAKTPGHAGLTDWALGTSADYNVNDDWKLSLGGSYRESNAYAFDLNSVFADGSTRAVHGSATATYGSFVGGFELIDGTADGMLGAPTLGVHGYQASLAYVLNENLQLTAGWQQLRYSRDLGVFYTGAPKIGMNAGYFLLDFHV
jgi:hypothetical protein